MSCDCQSYHGIWSDYTQSLDIETLPLFCPPPLCNDAQMMLLSEQPALWYSLPNFQGFLGTYIKPGHIYSLIHFVINSSMQLIQLDKKLVPMFLFHICNRVHDPNTGVGPPLCILGCKGFSQSTGMT